METGGIGQEKYYIKRLFSGIPQVCSPSLGRIAERETGRRHEISRAPLKVFPECFPHASPPDTVTTLGGTSDAAGIAEAVGGRTVAADLDRDADTDSAAFKVQPPAMQEAS